MSVRKRAGIFFFTPPIFKILFQLPLKQFRGYSVL